MKHTPGPWEAEQVYGVNYRHPVWFIRLNNSISLKSVKSGQLQDADAHLIAAAPDLLHACEGLLEILPECECDNTHEQHNTVCRMCWARQAISRAKGGE